jgi:hypothetical protein
MEEVIKNKYHFEGMRFIPGYNDFDYDDALIEAESIEDAWNELDTLTKSFTWKSVELTEINGIRYYESV